MNTLCFMSDMTSAEWAAWVQAGATFVAIVGSAAVAIWQLRTQRENSMKLQKAEQRSIQIERGTAILTQATNCKMLVINTAGQFRLLLGDPAIQDESLEIHFSMIKALGRSLAAISLHDLPVGFITPVMLFNIYVSQFIDSVQFVLDRRARMGDRTLLKSEEFSKVLDQSFGNVAAQLEQLSQDMLMALNQI